MGKIETGAGRTMSVGQLRQNPTEMIHDVESGHPWVLTNHGRAFGRIVPYAQKGWVPIDDAVDLLNTPTDPEWLADLQADRAASDMSDPWLV